jgi:hypothetical protein
LDYRLCKVSGSGGMPGSTAGVMRLVLTLKFYNYVNPSHRLPSLSAARDVEARLNGWRLSGWLYDLKVVVIDNRVVGQAERSMRIHSD